MVVIVTTCIAVIAFCSVAIAQNNNLTHKKFPELTAVEEYIAEAEAKGEKVSDELYEKKKWLEEYDRQVAENFEKSQKEIEELMIQRANAPKDEKGNPIVPDNPYMYDPVVQYDDLGVYYGKNHYDGLFVRESQYAMYQFTTTARTPYSILVSGCSSDDSTTGAIYELKHNPLDRTDTNRNEYTYPEKGTINFKGLEENNTIVTFTFGDDQEGYFILLSSEAIFEPYKK